MSRICPQCLDANPSDRSAQADVILREEPDQEEDEEEDDGDSKEVQTTAIRSERALLGSAGEE